MLICLDFADCKFLETILEAPPILYVADKILLPDRFDFDEFLDIIFADDSLPLVK
jgi:hypothetical protein